ncbi:hypothetical protein MACH17_10830 [Phaeobacter inhibens]|nr:hypothetical protein MACH17_10830 [Phaeobacter inhibens]
MLRGWRLQPVPATPPPANALLQTQSPVDPQQVSVLHPNSPAPSTRALFFLTVFFARALPYSRTILF